MLPDLTAALLPVVEAFKRLGVGYYIAGSVASSAHGLPRTTLDVDLVADLNRDHVTPLVEQLQPAYYIDAEMIFDALARRSSFNLIHLGTMLKVDVFVLKQDPYDQTAYRRTRDADEETRAAMHGLVLATPEDVILHKLYWYRLGGEVSERQWNDVLGVLRVQGEAQ